MHTECPACGFHGLREDLQNFRCVRCHCRYTKQFIRKIRRKQFSETIAAHFSGAVEQVLPVSVAVEVAAAEKNLDDYVRDATLQSIPFQFFSNDMPALIKRRETLPGYNPDDFSHPR